MRFMNRASVLLAALLLILASAGCSDPDDGAAAPKIHVPRRLRAVIVPQPGSLFPHEGSNYVDGQLSDAIFNNLVYANYMGSLSPELAENWDISPDHRQYTFHLRRGVRFHDGRPFSAADVVFTLENLIAKAQGKFAEINYIEGNEDFLNKRTPGVRGIRVIDDHTVQIRLNSEFKFFLPFLAAEYAAVIPAGLAGKSEADFRWHPVGTGPFRLARSENRVSGSRHYRVFSLERNRSYFAATGNLDAIDFYTSQHRHRRCHCRRLRPPVHFRPTRSPGWRASTSSRFINSSPTILNFLILNPGENDRMRQLKVRQLIYFAINREELVRQVFQNQAMPAHSMIPFGLLGHNPYYRLDYSPRRRHPRRAAARDASRFTIADREPRTDRRELVAEFVRRELAKFDVDVKVVTIADPVRILLHPDLRLRRQRHPGRHPGLPVLFPFPHATWWSPTAITTSSGSRFPGLQARIKTLPSLDMVSEARMLAEINAALEREALYVPLYHYSNFIAIREPHQGHHVQVRRGRRSGPPGGDRMNQSINHIKDSLLAGQPIVQIVSFEEKRVESFLKKLCQQTLKNQNIYSWDSHNGLSRSEVHARRQHGPGPRPGPRAARSTNRLFLSSRT